LEFRRTARIASIAAGALVLLIALGIALLHSGPARRYVLRQLPPFLGELGIDFQAVSLDYNLFQPSVELHGVRVQSAAALDLPPLVTLDRVSVRLRWLPLLRGRFEVAEAELTRPAVHLVIEETGRDNIPRFPEKEEEAPEEELNYLVRRFLADGGVFRFEDRRHGVDVSVPAWKVSIGGQFLPRQHEIVLECPEPAEVRFQGRPFPVEELRAEVVLRPNEVETKRILIRASGSEIEVSGRLGPFKNPELQADVRAHLLAAPLARLAGVAQRVEGQLRVDGHVEGPADAIRVQARLEGTGFGFDRVRGIALSAESHYDAAAEHVSIDDLRVTSHLGALRASGRVALSEAAGQSVIRATLSNADLVRAGQLAALPVSVPSRASAAIEARWPALDFEKAYGSASIRLEPQGQIAKDTIPVEANLTATGSLSRLDVAINELHALSVEVNGNVSLSDRSRIEGAVEAEVPSLTNLLLALSRFEGSEEQELETPDLEGSALLSVTLNGTVEKPQAGLELSAKVAKAGPVRDAALSARASANPSRIDVQAMQLDWAGQSLTAEGTVELTGESPALDLRAKVDAAPIEAFLTAFNEEVPVTGVLSLHAEASGTAAEPLVQTTVSIRELMAYQENFGTLDVEARLQNDTVHLTKLALDKPGSGGLLVSGSYDLKRNIYNVRAESQDIVLHGLMLPGGQVLRGQLALNAIGTGTIDEPELAATLEVSRLHLNGMDLGDLNAQVDLLGEAARAQIRAPKFRLTVTGSSGLQEPYAAQVELVADRSELSSLPVEAAAKLSGTLSARVTATGSLDEWQKGEVDARVEPLDLRWENIAIRSAGPLAARLANRILSIEPWELRAAESTLRLEGNLPLDESAPGGSVRLTGQFSLPGIAALFGNEDRPIEARGEASLNAELRGNFKRIEPELSLALDGGLIKAEGVNPLEALRLLVSVKDGAVVLDELSARFATAGIRVTGEAPLGVLLPEEMPVELPRREGPARLTMDVSKLDLSALEGAPRDLSGAVSLRLEAEAFRPDLEEISARLEFPDLSFRYQTLRLAQKGASTVVIRKGMASFEQFELEGPEAKLHVSGSAGLTEPNLLDLQAQGDFNLAVLASVVEGLRGQGPLQLRMEAGGTLSNPRIYGYVDLKDGQLAMRQPTLGAENLNLRVEMKSDRIEISNFSGELNGGKLTGSGGLSIAGGELRNPTLDISAENVFLNFPEGLRTASSVALRLRERQGRLLLSGQARILEGSYTEPLVLDVGLIRSLQSGTDISFTAERNPVLQRLDYDILIATASPLLINNNLAKAEVTIDLQLLGNYYSPGLNGRVVVESQGILILQEREYIIERGLVTFANERRIEPTLDIQARTEVSGYNVNLLVTGGGGQTLETTLTADPPLAEPDIIALLLTGKRLEEVRGSETDVVAGQALSLLAGNVGGRLSRQLQRATGLSQVRIEPNLIAQESDPSARLTLGQDLTRQLRLIYSMNLANSSDQIYIAEYDITRRFQARYLKQDDNSNRFEFRHDLRFGATGERTAGASDARLVRIVGQVQIAGNPFFPEDRLLGRLKARPGRPYDFFRVRRGLESIEKLYAKSDLLEARLRLQREESDSRVDLTLNVEPGPKVSFEYEGWDPPGDLRKRIRELWQDGVFDAQRIDEAERAIREVLVRRNYLDGRVETSVTVEEDRKTVLFRIEPGLRYERVHLKFDGASEDRAPGLERTIREGRMDLDIFTRPGRVADLLTRHYQEQGFLSAQVRDPSYEFDPEKREVAIIFPVNEGERYQVRTLTFQGNQAFSESQLLSAIALRSGQPYEPARRQESLEALEELYHRNGFNEVEVVPVVSRDDRRARVDVTFRISEGTQSILKEVVVEGTKFTAESLVKGQLIVREDEPLNLNDVSRSRRNLYSTGAYSLIDIERERLESAVGLGPNQTPVRLKVRVREIQPWELRYGAYFDTERGPGGIVDLENRNMLGMARVLGFRSRYDSDLREGRIYFSQPFLQRFPLRSIASSFFRRELRPGFIVDRIGASFQQETRFGRHYVLNYGYRLERNHTFEREPDPLFPFDVTIRVAPLTSTFTRETRDDFLDASRGSFFSQAVEWAPETLGSQVSFVRYFGQYFKYVPLSRPSELPWTNIQKSRLVYAGALRVGLAAGLGGQDLVASERFFAGGGTTVRGFEQNTLGPLGFDGAPDGGGGMLVINNELRFPMFSIFDGVGFLDMGNIYRRVSDMSLRDLRYSGGFGLRLRTPYFLLRLDYGVKLDRRPGESFGEFFFSIGQAF
jgi:outer membrane protein assembly complex protein YaeT